MLVTLATSPRTGLMRKVWVNAAETLGASHPNLLVQRKRWGWEAGLQVPEQCQQVAQCGRSGVGLPFAAMGESTVRDLLDLTSDTDLPSSFLVC